MNLNEWALHKSSAKNLDDFEQQVINFKSSNQLNLKQLVSKIYFEIPGTNIGIPASTFIHDDKKHNITKNDWNRLIKFIDKPLLYVEAKRSKAFIGTNYLYKYNFDHKFYGLGACKTKTKWLISTFFTDKEANIDNWLLGNGKAQPEMPTAAYVPGCSLSEGLNYILTKNHLSVKSDLKENFNNMDIAIQELLQQIALENFFVKSSKGNYLSVTKNEDKWIAQGKEVKRQQDIEYLNKQYENNLKDLTKTYNDLMDELQYGLWDSGNLSIAQNEILNYLLEKGIIIRTPGIPGEHDTINGTAKWIYSLNESTEPAKNKMYRDIATKEANSKEEFLQILKEDELDNVNQIATIMDNNSDTQINYSRVRKELYEYGDVYIWTDKIPVNKLIVQDEDLVAKEINGLKYQGLEIDENTKPIIVLGNWNVIDGRHRAVRAKKQSMSTLSGYVPADIWYDLEMKKNINEAGYNWNNGMSNNAVQAYNNGERPLSKWNKSDLLSEFKKELDNIDSDYLINTYNEIIKNKETLYSWLSKQSKERLQKLLLDKSSWHHTSKFYNVTNFYTVDLDIALDRIYQDDEFEEVLNSINEDIKSPRKTMLKIFENVVSMASYRDNKVKDNLEDFANSLIEMGTKINPSNPYDYVADKLEEMSKWSIKQWEAIYKRKLSFNELRSAQLHFDEMSKHIRKIADDYEESKHIKEAKMSLSSIEKKLSKLCEAMEEFDSPVQNRPAINKPVSAPVERQSIEKAPEKHAVEKPVQDVKVPKDNNKSFTKKLSGNYNYTSELQVITDKVTKTDDQGNTSTLFKLTYNANNIPAITMTYEDEGCTKLESIKIESKEALSNVINAIANELGVFKE